MHLFNLKKTEVLTLKCIINIFRVHWVCDLGVPASICEITRSVRCLWNVSCGLFIMRWWRWLNIYYVKWKRANWQFGVRSLLMASWNRAGAARLEANSNDNHNSNNNVLFQASTKLRRSCYKPPRHDVHSRPCQSARSSLTVRVDWVGRFAVSWWNSADGGGGRLLITGLSNLLLIENSSLEQTSSVCLSWTHSTGFRCSLNGRWHTRAVSNDCDTPPPNDC